MSIEVSRGLIIRSLEDNDIESIQKLQLKLGDQIEISRLTGFSNTEYIKWHLENYGSCTKVLVFNSEIIGILGIEKGSKILFFLTEEIPKGIRSSFIRHFRRVLDILLDEVDLNECFILIDTDYKVSYNWARRYGFSMVEEIYLDNFKAEFMAIPR